MEKKNTSWLIFKATRNNEETYFAVESPVCFGSYIKSDIKITKDNLNEVKGKIIDHAEAIAESIGRSGQLEWPSGDNGKADAVEKLYDRKECLDELKNVLSDIADVQKYHVVF